jgi:hypothetical protein
MTDEQINMAIAEALNADEHWMIQKNYCTDLNAMHEAEKVVISSHGQTYSNELAETTKVHYYNDTDFFCATARQRAEAFLRTLGKWKGVSKMIELSKEQKELYVKLDAWEKCADNLVEYAREFTSHLSAWGKGYGRYDREIREAEESIATYNKLKNEKGDK